MPAARGRLVEPVSDALTPEVTGELQVRSMSLHPSTSFAIPCRSTLRLTSILYGSLLLICRLSALLSRFQVNQSRSLCALTSLEPRKYGPRRW